MKKILLILLFTIGSGFLVADCFAQGLQRETTAPAGNPPSGFQFYYTKSGSSFCTKNSSGVEFCTGTGTPSGSAGGDLTGSYPNPTVAKVNGNTPGGTCTNQVVTALSTSAAPTCTTVTSAYVDNSIALTGTDINTSNQITATHLASALPINQGGTGTETGAAQNSVFAGPASGGSGAPSFQTAPTIAVTNMTGTGGFSTTGNAATATAVNFSGVASSTNTTAAMVVGSGASLAPTGTGMITATRLNGNGVYDAKANGLVCNGSTDDTAALNTLLSTVSTNGGGTVVFPVGTCLLASAITIPNDSASPPRQKPLRLTGYSPDVMGQGAYTPAGGTILNLTYGSGTAKFYSTGVGNLEIDHISLEDTAGDAVPFVATTNTTLRIHDTSFFGSKSGTAANQDAILLGVSATPFQGYGTVIENNFFDYIRRAVYMLIEANAVVFSNNTIWAHAGSDQAGGAAVELVGTGAQDAGNVITGNTIELTGYIYGIKLTDSTGNFIKGNSFWDGTGGLTLAAVYGDSASTGNTIECALVSGYTCNGGAMPATSTLYLNTFQQNFIPVGLNINGPYDYSQLGVYGIAFIHADWASAAPSGTSQLIIRGATNDNLQLQFAYNTSTNFGSIQSQNVGTASTPLKLNPAGGALTSYLNTLDDGSGNATVDLKQTAATYATATNCAAAGSAANPSLVACGAAASGSFSVATNASTGTAVISTTAITTASRIFVQPTQAANTLTCNATADTGLTVPRLASQSNGTSFTINLGAFITTALCFNYWVVN